MNENNTTFTFSGNYNDDAKLKEYIKTKPKASYLPWATAWLKFKEKYPEGSYRVIEFENNLPLPTAKTMDIVAEILNKDVSLEEQTKAIVETVRLSGYSIKSIYQYDPLLGYRVAIQLSLDGKNYFEPTYAAVADGQDTLREFPYTLTNKDGYQRTIKAATFSDIHNTIMRCIVKAIAINTGIGLSLWVNDDRVIASEIISEMDAIELKAKIKSTGVPETWYLKAVEKAQLGKVKALHELNISQMEYIYGIIEDTQQRNERIQYIRDGLKKISMSEKELMKIAVEKINQANEKKPADQKIPIPVSLDTMSTRSLYDTCIMVLELEKKSGKTEKTSTTTAAKSGGKAKTTKADATEPAPPDFLK